MPQGKKRSPRNNKKPEKRVYKAGKPGSELEKLRNTLLQGEDAYRGIIDFNQTLLSAIPMGMDIVDGDHNVLFTNRNIEALSGRRKGDKKCWELYKDKNEPCRGCPLEKDLKKGEVGVLEEEDMFGGKVYQIIYIGMVYNGRKAMMELFQDITVRRQAEESLKETMRIKSNFISMVSHELRTPLIIIKEGVNTVKMMGEVNDKQNQYLDMINRNATRLTKLVKNVLNFQKMSSGKETFDIAENDINGAVKEVCDTMHLAADKKKLDILIDVETGLPALNFDRDKIVQVLINLVANSIKFTEKGGITIITRKKGDAVQVTVRDTGSGIKSDDIPKLFHAFEQLGKNKSKNAEGTGLGLIISKEIVERHNGKMWVDSKEGEWTAFHFILPVNGRQNGKR